MLQYVDICTLLLVSWILQGMPTIIYLHCKYCMHVCRLVWVPKHFFTGTMEWRRCMPSSASATLKWGCHWPCSSKLTLTLNTTIIASHLIWCKGHMPYSYVTKYYIGWDMQLWYVGAPLLSHVATCLVLEHTYGVGLGHTKPLSVLLSLICCGFQSHTIFS